MNNNSDYKEDAMEGVTTHDPGGGGDMTFHQIKEAHPPESHQDKLNTNTDTLILDGEDNGRDATIEDEIKSESSGVKEEQEQKRGNGDGVEDGSDDHMIASDTKAEQECDQEVERQDTDGQERSTSEGTGGEKLSKGLESQEHKDEDKETLDFRDPRKLDRQQRSNVYNKACVLQQEGSNDKALKYFIAAITGLTENNSFHELPQCLHNMSNIYFEKNEYEKAVHFIQAEKMYYETALLDIVNLQKHLAEKQKSGETSEVSPDNSDQTNNDDKILDTKDTDPEISKAREFDNLARLCLKEGKPQLALEYCGKATKIYRSQLGDEHPVTVGSLDLFALVYADVGKKLYQGAMEKFGVDEDNADDAATSHTESSTKQDNISTEGIRQRNKPGKETLVRSDQRSSEHHRRVHFEEYEPNPPVADQDDWVTTVLLMILFFLITVLIALIGSFFYCRNNERSEMCAEFKGDLTYWYMKIQHTIKYYTSSGRR